jgi:hypothetical protein
MPLQNDVFWSHFCGIFGPLGGRVGLWAGELPLSKISPSYKPFKPVFYAAYNLLLVPDRAKSVFIKKIMLKSPLFSLNLSKNLSKKENDTNVSQM